MANPHSRVPQADIRKPAPDAPNAALLVDFDNVTMGMRSDLANELRTLLGSDIIKGKVTVQRAYADWRRYPQYIVPLSEASIDLIFAPAYGSSKKNATDIRMAIDGIELVFIRPDIGTFILLTGDSDFSSLVLKLKEYGKYVIGIGIQESSSDILVQNCDEYYSYTSLAGLSRSSDGKPAGADPWQAVREALQRMTERGDVMRSDRLKQVLIEISPGFDERNLGFKKFSRFLVEASRKGLLELQRGQNGQYAVAAPGGEEGGAETPQDAPSSSSAKPRRSPKRPAPRRDPAQAGANGDEAASATPNLSPALDLLSRALKAAAEDGRASVRDSTIKRRLLALDGSFDEGALGFAKFSKFLHFAADRGHVELLPVDGGGYDVRLARLDVRALGLPHTKEAMESYLANRYRGVGAKTAEALVERFGADLFSVLQDDPGKVRAALPRTRADQVLQAWGDDYARRAAAQAKAAGRPKPGSAGLPQSPRSAPGGAGGSGHAAAARGRGPARPPASRGPRRSREPRRAEPDAARPGADRSGPAARDASPETARVPRSGDDDGAANVAAGARSAPADPASDGGASKSKKSSGIVGFLRQATRRTRDRGANDD